MKLFLSHLLTIIYSTLTSHLISLQDKLHIHYIHGDEAFDDDSNAIIDLLVLLDSGKKQLRVTSVRLRSEPILALGTSLYLII